MIDSMQAFETPEGVSLGLNPAGPLPRAMALLIDLVLQNIIISVMTIVGRMLYFGGFGGVADGVFAIIIFVWFNFYFVYCEAKYGKTLGKHILKLQVVSDTGRPIGFSTAFIRNLIRPIEFLPLFFGSALVVMLFNAKFKRIGDIVAGSLVVYNYQAANFSNIVEKTPQPLPRSLKLEEQRTILEFGERSATISQARATELATYLQNFEPQSAPLTDAALSAAATVQKQPPGTAPSTDKLLAYANWIKKGGKI